MSRKSFFLALGIALVLTGTTSATLFLLIRHEPDIYRRACLPPGKERIERSQECYKELSPLVGTLINHGGELDIRLTDEQINSFFAEDFKKSKIDKYLLTEQISEPRVLLEPGKIRLAFRYGRGLWSTIISLDFGVWLAAEEPNVVAMELQGLHAGSLPIGTQMFLDDLSKLAEQNNIQVNWYRHPETGNSVALLRFQNEQREAAIQLETLQIDQGSIFIRGHSADIESARAAFLPMMDRLPGD
jgi:hypothetical protein